MKRFLLLYLPLVLLVGALTAYLGIHLSQARQDRIESRDAEQLQASARLLSRELERSLQQLQGLEREPVLLRALADPPDQARSLVQALLESLLYRNAPYAQARWLGPDGIERVRVNRDGTAVVPVTRDELQDKSDRPYFTEAIRLAPGQFYLSALDLNVEHGQVELPHRPMIRAAIRLPTVKEVDQGLLVVNLAVQHLLDDYADISSATQGGKRMLLDSQGRWLLAPDPQDAWGHLFGRDNSLAKRQPWAWQQMTDQPSGRLQDASGLWIWNSVDPAKLWPGQIQAAEHWKLVSHLDRDLIQLLWWQGWPLLFLNAGVMLLLLLAFGVRRYAKLLSAHDATAAELEAAYQLQQSAAELQKSHDLLSMAEEGAGAGFWDWDMALGPDRMNWSKQTFRLFGLDPATASASLEAWRRAVHPDDLPLAETRIEEAFRERRHYAVSYRVILPDGAIRWIDAFGKVSYDEAGRPRHFSGLCLDATARKEAEQSLIDLNAELERKVQERTAEIQLLLAKMTASEGRFRAIFDQAPIGIALLNPRDGQIQDCNERYAAIAGRSVEELRCIGCMAITHPDDLTAAMAQMGRLDAGEIPSFQMDARFLKPDGSQVWVRRTVAPVQMEAGSSSMLLCMVQDISQQKQAEQDLLAAKEAAEQASRAKGDFVANMSHEIRTPMNAVLGFLDILSDSSLDPQQRTLVEKVQKSSRALLRILNDILDFSKLDAGAVNLELAPFELDEVLHDAVDLFALSASSKGLELVLDVAPALPKHYRGDALRLGQILVNLLGNAIKFTEQGSVQLAVRALDQAAGQTRLRFEVKDTGIGLTAEQIERLFKPFSQADNSTTRRFGGTGLGLIIAKRLADLMGGEIGVDSEPGLSSTFWFTVPLASDEAVQPSEPPALRPERVLLVDDHESVREILGRMMRSWGFSVDTVADAQTALQCLRQAEQDDSRYSLLVLDWSMPEHDGLWLLRQLHQMTAVRQMQRTPAVLMVTAYDRLALVRAAAQEPVQPDAVLSKPVTASRLLDTVLELQQRGFVSLPVAETPVRDPYRQAEPIRGAKLLLVEDNPTNQEIALAMLGKMGLQVSVAHHGREALDQLASQPFDLVLMDLQMPVMDGFEATSAIRATSWGRDLPIVAMTAAAFADDRRRVLEAGMNDFVSKPVDPQQLLDVLLRWLPHRPPQVLAAAAGLPALTDEAATVSAPAFPAATQALLPAELDGFEVAQTLHRLDHDQDLLLRALRQFLRDFPADDWVAQFDAACRQADWITAQRQAHTLKGVAGNLGAVRVQQAATALDALLKTAVDQSGCDPDPLAQRRDDCLQALRAAIAVLQDKLPAEAVPALGATEPAQPEAALQDLAEAEQLLRRNRGLPAALLPRLRAHLGQHAAQAQFDRLTDQVRAFDFAGALETIKAMRELLSS